MANYAIISKEVLDDGTFRILAVLKNDTGKTEMETAFSGKIAPGSYARVAASGGKKYLADPDGVLQEV